MKRIELANGGTAIVDDDDYDSLAVFKWYRHKYGYAFRKVYRYPLADSGIYMHRAVLPDAALVDHINRDKLDNRKCNLRAADKSTNAHNAGKPRNNTSGHRGVSFHADKGKWYAALKFRGHLYRQAFSTKEEAVAARAELEARFHAGAK